MRRLCVLLAAVFVLSVMVATAAPAMADDNWRGGKNWSWGWDHGKKHHKDRHHKNWNWWRACDWEWTPWGWKWDCPWWD